jgi:hypothetical protein
MNYIESKLIPLLGKGMDDPGIRQAISDLALADVDDDPEMHRRYVGADEKDGVRRISRQMHFRGVLRAPRGKRFRAKLLFRRRA